MLCALVSVPFVYIACVYRVMYYPIYIGISFFLCTFHMPFVCGCSVRVCCIFMPCVCVCCLYRVCCVVFIVHALCVCAVICEYAVCAMCVYCIKWTVHYAKLSLIVVESTRHLTPHNQLFTLAFGQTTGNKADGISEMAYQHCTIVNCSAWWL